MERNVVSRRVIAITQSPLLVEGLTHSIFIYLFHFKANDARQEPEPNHERNICLHQWQQYSMKAMIVNRDSTEVSLMKKDAKRKLITDRQ